MPSPEAIPQIKTKHVQTLERRRNYLLAVDDESMPGNSYDRAEIAALNAAIAALNELIAQRQVKE